MCALIVFCVCLCVLCELVVVCFCVCVSVCVCGCVLRVKSWWCRAYMVMDLVVIDYVCCVVRKLCCVVWYAFVLCRLCVLRIV